MAGKTRTKRERPRAFAHLRAALGDRARVLNALGAAISGAAVLAVLASLVVGYGPLAARAAQMRSAPEGIEIAWPLMPLPANAPPGLTPTTWLDAGSRTSLERLVTQQVGRGRADGRSIRAAQEALLRTGWFDEVRGGVRVELESDGVVRVRGAWRVPVAAVRQGETDHLVASGGELLPPRYPRDGSRMRVILGASQMAPEHGQSWPGGDVQAGLELLAFLARTPGFHQVYAIDVSEYVHGNQLAIVTDRGNRIVWGGGVSPGRFTPGQAKPEKKLEELAKLFAAYGRIDAGRAVIDLRPEAGPYILAPEIARR